MKQLTGYLNIDKVSLTYPDFLMITENACKNIRERYYEKLDKDTVYTSFTIGLRDGEILIRKLPYH